VLKIDGIGTSIIEIEGVDSLHPVDEEIIPDRIEAGTYLIAAAMTQGKLKLQTLIHTILLLCLKKWKKPAAILM
jgi:UDP-N-acetylglucosamine 1-carboxyvinyltransferase